MTQEEQKIILDLFNAAKRMRSATGEGYEDRDESEEGEAWNQLDAAIHKAEFLIRKWR